MKKTAAIAWLLLGASLLANAAFVSDTPQAPLNALTNEQLLERIDAEIAFARGLSELTPRRTAEWNPLIARAEDIVKAMKASRMRGDPAAEVLKAEKMLEPLGREAKSYTVHSVGHAHIDMNWMWPWPETVAVTNDTFTTVLRLMDEFPDFCFTQSQASVYALIKKHNPDLFEKIKKRVAVSGSPRTPAGPGVRRPGPAPGRGPVTDVRSTPPGDPAHASYRHCHGGVFSNPYGHGGYPQNDIYRRS